MFLLECVTEVYPVIVVFIKLKCFQEPVVWLLSYLMSVCVSVASEFGQDNGQNKTKILGKL